MLAMYSEKFIKTGSASDAVSHSKFAVSAFPNPSTMMKKMRRNLSVSVLRELYIEHRLYKISTNGFDSMGTGHHEMFQLSSAYGESYF